MAEPLATIENLGRSSSIYERIQTRAIFERACESVRAQLAEALTENENLRFNLRATAQELMALANEDNQEKPE